jgi:branched-chain amino acid transport system substrate-binding protein
MKLKSAIIPLTAAIGLAFAGTARIGSRSRSPTGPLSGPNAHMGKDNENGARMAVDELNAKVSDRWQEGQVRAGWRR